MAQPDDVKALRNSLNEKIEEICDSIYIPENRHCTVCPTGTAFANFREHAVELHGTVELRGAAHREYSFCPYCDFVTVKENQREFEAHENDHVHRKPYACWVKKCQEAGKKFRGRTELCSHIVKVHKRGGPEDDILDRMREQYFVGIKEGKARRHSRTPCSPAQAEVSKPSRRDAQQERQIGKAAPTSPTYPPSCSPPAPSTPSQNASSGRASRSEGRAPNQRRGSWGRPPPTKLGEPAQLPLSYAPSNAFKDKGPGPHDGPQYVLGGSSGSRRKSSDYTEGAQFTDARIQPANATSSHNLPRSGQPLRATSAQSGRRTSYGGPASSSTSRDVMAPSSSAMTSSVVAGHGSHSTWNGNNSARLSLNSANRGRGSANRGGRSSAHYDRDFEHPVRGPAHQQDSSAYHELEPAYHPAHPAHYPVVAARYPIVAAEGAHQLNSSSHQPTGFSHPSYPGFNHPLDSMNPPHDISNDPSDTVSHSPPLDRRSPPAKKLRPSPVLSISNTSRRSSMPSSSRRSPMPKSSKRPSTPRTHARRGSGPASPWRGSAPASAGYSSSSGFPSTPTSSGPSSNVFAPSPYAPTQGTHDLLKATKPTEARGLPLSSRASAHQESPGWGSVPSSMAPSPSHPSALSSWQGSAPGSYVDSSGCLRRPPALHARSASESAKATSGGSIQDAELATLLPQLMQHPEVQAGLRRAAAAVLSASVPSRSAPAYPLGSPFRHPSEPRTSARRDSSASTSPWHSRNASGASTPPSASDSSPYASDPSSHQASAPGSRPELNGWLVDAPAQYAVASHDHSTAPACGEPCRGDPTAEVGATDLDNAMRQMAFGTAPSESASAHPGSSFEQGGGTDSSQGYGPQQDQAQNLGLTAMRADPSELPQEWQGFSLQPSQLSESAMLECPQSTERTAQADGRATGLADTANNVNWHPWSEGMPASSPNLVLPAPEQHPPSTVLPQLYEMPCQDGQNLSGNANSFQDNPGVVDSMGEQTFLMDEDMRDPVYNTFGLPDYQFN